ncbi:hypothetical protein ACN47E_004102 [Coniothyrium glycines]
MALWHTGIRGARRSPSPRSLLVEREDFTLITDSITEDFPSSVVHAFPTPTSTPSPYSLANPKASPQPEREHQIGAMAKASGVIARKRAASRPARRPSPFGPVEQRTGMRLKINLRNTGGTPAPESPVPPSSPLQFQGSVNAIEVPDEKLSLSPCLALQGRPRRERKPNEHPDYIYGSGPYPQLSDVSKIDVEDGPVLSSTSRNEPHILSFSTPSASRSRPYIPPARPDSHQAADRSFSTIVSDPQVAASTSHLSSLAISPSLTHLFTSLRTHPTPLTHLPPLLSSSPLTPFTAAHLTHLYILAYTASLPHLCDLIIDTWIRAFHTQRTQSPGLWRPNPALTRREHTARSRRNAGLPPEPTDPAPQYNLPGTDPVIDASATRDIHIDLLSALYTYTAPECGARLLWADALALGGQDVETALVKQTTQQHATGARATNNHNNNNNNNINVLPEAFWRDLACTGLRLVRRKLTLKIEERGEGDWCKRYHEHTRSGARCYRVLAKEEMGTTVDEDELAQEMARELGIGVGSDRDAEGDSEEE